MQAPGRADEDRRGGFEHGGWAAPDADPVMGSVASEGMTSTGGILLGRRTYEDFPRFWPNQPEPKVSRWPWPWPTDSMPSVGMPARQSCGPRSTRRGN